MTRDLTAGMLSEITADALRPVLLVSAEFASGTVRLWTGCTDIVHDGNTYTGAGHLLSISDMTETVDARAVGITIALSGMPGADVAGAHRRTTRTSVHCHGWRYR